jgi:hypothetical protein
VACKQDKKAGKLACKFIDRMAIVKPGSLQIFLDVASFFLVTVDLYGEDRLQKLSRLTARVIIRIWHWQKVGGPAAIAALIGALLFWFSGFGFALVHIFSQGLYNQAYQYHHSSTLETVLGWTLLLSLVSPPFILLALWLAMAMLVRVRLSGWMLGTGAILFIYSRYLTYVDLPG